MEQGWTHNSVIIMKMVDKILSHLLTTHSAVYILINELSCIIETCHPWMISYICQDSVTLTYNTHCCVHYNKWAAVINLQPMKFLPTISSFYSRLHFCVILFTLFTLLTITFFLICFFFINLFYLHYSLLLLLFFFFSATLINLFILFTLLTITF